MDDLHREIPVDHRVNVKYVSTRGAIVGAKHACRLKRWKTSVPWYPFVLCAVEKEVEEGTAVDISWKMKDCENGRKEPYVVTKKENRREQDLRVDGDI